MLISPPDGWQLTTLRELGELNRGRSRHRPRYADHLYGGPYPFVQTGDIKASNGRVTSFTQTYSEAGLAQSRLWPAGTMCITIAANIAETAVLQFPACFPDSVVGFVPDTNKADVQFIEYMFRFLRRIIQHQASGTVQDNINVETLDRLSFPVPPLRTQRAIAHILGTLDDKIELNRRMNATLESMARALFQSWFVDFDPVRAKMDGRPPAGMDAETAVLFPDSFEESELGLIPKGWRIRSYGEVASRIAMGPFGSRITRDNFVTDGVPVIRGGNLKSGFVDEDFVFLTESKTDELKASVAMPLDIVFTHRGTLGQVGIIPLNARYPRYVVSQSQMLLSVDNSLCSPWFAYMYFSSPQGIDALLANTSTTGVPAISRPTTSLKAIKQVFPPLQIAQHFDFLLGPLVTEQTVSVQQSRTLATLRDTLLPKLLSGELSVKHAERLVEA